MVPEQGRYWDAEEYRDEEDEDDMVLCGPNGQGVRPELYKVAQWRRSNEDAVQQGVTQEEYKKLKNKNKLVWLFFFFISL